MPSLVQPSFALFRAGVEVRQQLAGFMTARYCNTYPQLTDQKTRDLALGPCCPCRRTDHDLRASISKLPQAIARWNRAAGNQIDLDWNQRSGVLGIWAASSAGCGKDPSQCRCPESMEAISPLPSSTNPRLGFSCRCSCTRWTGRQRKSLSLMASSIAWHFEEMGTSDSRRQSMSSHAPGSPRS